MKRREEKKRTRTRTGERGKSKKKMKAYPGFLPWVVEEEELESEFECEFDTEFEAVVGFHEVCPEEVEERVVTPPGHAVAFCLYAARDALIIVFCMGARAESWVQLSALMVSGSTNWPHLEVATR